jgi:hypothetical protein
VRVLSHARSLDASHLQSLVKFMLPQSNKPINNHIYDWEVATMIQVAGLLKTDNFCLEELELVRRIHSSKIVLKFLLHT